MSRVAAVARTPPVDPSTTPACRTGRNGCGGGTLSTRDEGGDRPADTFRRPPAATDPATPDLTGPAPVEGVPATVEPVVPVGVATRVARLVTEVTAPAVLVTGLTVVIGWHSVGGARGLVWGLLATVFAAGVPFAYILGGVRRGRLTDHHLGRREQRRMPLLLGLASAAVGLALLAALGAPRPVLALVAAGVVGLVVAVAVSHWWKMSIHSAVAAGTLVVLVLTFGPRLLPAVPLLALVGWSRVRLRDHTVAQVVVGALVGGLVAGLVYAPLS
ncbi:PAP2 superfamily protein [Micromonospora matsumotoense]|uniref:PAP2 superfamily protein n=1 Tax=Micromonospora matsumotoense TaxID=121616 RepID=A0A1C5AMN5_9ACTN|nr:PAP2 superfamily protein [Micromonospora matsumotoense]